MSSSGLRTLSSASVFPVCERASASAAPISFGDASVGVANGVVIKGTLSIKESVAKNLNTANLDPPAQRAIGPEDISSRARQLRPGAE